MPRVIDCEAARPLALGDVVQALNDEGFDPGDEESFAAAAPLLKGLAANRDFLADVAVAELKDRCRDQSVRNSYGPQVVMLHRASEKYFIRANFWPAPSDSLFRSSGASPFFYHVPHDHNFSFLTVGYSGPGYWSDYYEYDYASVAGHVGEKVDLRFVERSRLEEGRVMLYRAHRDVHNQLPADAMSVSINIMEAAPQQLLLSQYRFDVERCEIAGVLTRTSTEALLALAANAPSGNGRDLVEGFARAHPCNRIQFAALRELAGTQGDVDAQIGLLERGTGDPDAYVATMSVDAIARLQAHRGWIERP